MKQIREGMNNLPKAITFPQYPSITAYDDGGEENVFIGNISEQYLRKFAFTSGTDKTFGFRGKDGKFYIGNKEAKIMENNIIVGDKEFAGTPGLWELVMGTTPDDKIFTNGGYDKYAEIMHSTNALRRNNNESETRPKANKSWKWKQILKPIWEEKDLYTGNGLTPAVPTIILPCIALVETLDILMASKAAGNTGVRNELVSVCDEMNIAMN